MRAAFVHPASDRSRSSRVCCVAETREIGSGPVVGNAARSLAILLVAGNLPLLAACPGQRTEQSVEKSSKRLDICKDFLRKNELEAAEAECGKAISLNTNNDEAYVIRGLVAM